MPSPPDRRGPWTHRYLVWFFSVVLAVLIYWLLGFVLADIGTWPGPSYEEVQSRMLDRELVGRRDDLTQRIDEADQEIDEQRSRQEIVRDSTANTQRTMDQLLELQRLGLEKNVTPTPAEQDALADAERLFLDNQKQYQQLNERIAELDAQLTTLRRDLTNAAAALTKAEQPVQTEFQRLVEQHQWRVAVAKLGVLTPLVALTALLFWRFRSGLYGPLVYALGIALLVRVFVVMHEYFPTKYFKYVLILALLAFTLWLLVRLLKLVARPQVAWLLKQYREAYESFLCPICEYPIRRGPMKYLYWSRRSLKRLQFPRSETPETDEAYTCPVCGTRLFEECSKCHAVRHSLLPACGKCGDARPVAALIAERS
jgi:hypothetical protein